MQWYYLWFFNKKIKFVLQILTVSKVYVINCMQSGVDNNFLCYNSTEVLKVKGTSIFHYLPHNVIKTLLFWDEPVQKNMTRWDMIKRNEKRSREFITWYFQDIHPFTIKETNKIQINKTQKQTNKYQIKFHYLKINKLIVHKFVSHSIYVQDGTYPN